MTTSVRMFLGAVLSTGLVVLACAAGADEAAVETILTEPLPDDAYARRQPCIPYRQVRDMEVLDGKRILFIGYNNRLWINQMAQTCYGLDRMTVINLDIKSHQVCRLDRFRAMERYAMGFSLDCTLGDFETVTEAQAALLRETLSSRRKAVAPAPVEAVTQ